MHDQFSSSALIEHCIRNYKSGSITGSPFQYLQIPYIKCCTSIKKLIGELITTLLKKITLKYPKLAEKIFDIVFNKYTKRRYDITCHLVNEYIKEEEDCIWVKNQSFRSEAILESIKERKSIIVTFRKEMTGYCNEIKNIAEHVLRKKIISQFIHGLVSDITSSLYSEMIDQDSTTIATLFYENSEIAIRRNELIIYKQKINEAKKNISCL
jgi:hypothetical protein